MTESVKPSTTPHKVRMNRYLLTFVVIFLGVLIGHFMQKPKPTRTQPRTYEEIIASGELRATTEYNTIGFHAEGDSIGGFQYELLQAFAQSKGLKAVFTPEMSFDKRLTGMLEGKFDILANNTPTTSELQDTMLFTHPILVSKQVLIQRKPTDEQDSTYIRNQLDLAQKTIHVVKNAPVIQRLNHLSNEIGENIYIEEMDKYGPEQLIALVASGEINYAVCDEFIARNAVEQYPNLDMKLDISFSQFYSWGVSKQSQVLLDTLNVWLDKYLKTKSFKQLQKKYFN